MTQSVAEAVGLDSGNHYTVSKKWKRMWSLYKKNCTKIKKTPSDHHFITRPHDFYVTLEIQMAAMVWYHVYFIVVTIFGTRGNGRLPTLCSLPYLPYCFYRSVGGDQQINCVALSVKRPEHTMHNDCFWRLQTQISLFEGISHFINAVYFAMSEKKINGFKVDNKNEGWKLCLYLVLLAVSKKEAVLKIFVSSVWSLPL